MMRHLDFSPLYRSTVGFDHLFAMLDSLGGDNSQSYPPYDIERTAENAYSISMAVAGFSESDILIELHRNTLTITGERAKESENESLETLYRGIATRSFTRCFKLADDVEIVGATLENGLLCINLERNIPEEMKPRKINITHSSKGTKSIESSIKS